MKHLKHNITKLYVIAALEGIVFYYAIDKLFMQARGLSLGEMIVIEIIFGAAVVLLEVPSGALSDRWSRKKVLALNSLFLIANTVLWAISHSFLLFAVGAVCGALHTVFRSGTDTSLLFDTLKQLGRDNEYEKHLGRKRAIGAVSFTLAAIAGGIIGGAYGLEATFWWTLPAAVAAGILALLLKEPEFHRSTDEVSYWKHITTTFSFLVKKPRLLHILAVVTAITIPPVLFDEYGQLYFALAGVSVFGLGLLVAGASALEALFSAIVERFAVIRHDVLFGVSFLLMGGGFLLAGFFQNWVGIVLLFAGYSTFFIVSILAESDLNRQLTSSIRATSESFFSLVGKLFYIPVAFAFAWIGENYSVATAFAVMGAGLLVWLIVYMLVSFRAIGRGSKDIID